MKQRVFIAALCLGMLFGVPAHAFSLRSPQVAEHEPLGLDQTLDSFGCNGKNVSPELTWENAPKETRSFAVTVYDPDAPTGSGWWHWVVFNIPADVRTLPAGAGDASGTKLPKGSVQSRTDFGMPGFGGACPPAGDKAHRYIFTVHALDVEQLDLGVDASAAMVGFMLHQHTVGKAKITAYYSR